MLRAEFAQGVDTVVLTPHYYPAREPLANFLSRRAAAWTLLQEAVLDLPAEEQRRLPQMVLGAEVAYVPGLHTVEGLDDLCIGNTKNMLLELPFYPWDKNTVRGIYDLLGRSGVTPVLAHIERYFFCQSRKFLDEVLDLGLPVQVGSQGFTRSFSAAFKLLKRGRAHLIASDCHDLRYRSPDLQQAMEHVRKKLGVERFVEVAELADQLAVAE